MIINEKKARFHICGQTFTHELTGGFSFARDAHGIYVTNAKKDDYHLDAGDVAVSPDIFQKRIAHIIGELVESRKESEAMEAMEALALKDIFLCFKDSLDAGNCSVGTKSFCNIHGLNPNKRYSAAEVLKKASGSDIRRVKIAICRAVRRMKKEEELGFCEI